MMKLASNVVLQEEYNYFYPKEELIILLTWWLPPLIKDIHSKSIFSRLSRLGKDPSISFKFGPTMKMKDEHSPITPRVSRQSSASKSQPTNFTYSLRVFFLHLRYSNTDEIHGRHIVLTGPPSRIPSLAKTLSQNAKTSRSSLFRTTLRPLFEVHTTTELELRLFHKTRDFQRPRWNIHEAQNSLDFMRDIREFLWIPCSPQRARSLSWAM